MKKLIPILLFIFLGCQVGPKNSKGESYDVYAIPVSTSGVGVFVGDGKRPPTAVLISGFLQLDGFSPAPLSNVEIKLIDEKSQSLATTTSGGGGKFTLQKALDKGKYRLLVSTAKYQGSLPFEYDNKDLENLQFLVHETKKK